ncbi:metallo-beta-lactamase class B [Granulicella rosea]|uniref:Metallo-beta-lactamase class B n=1 Tax=Granulicella rosea TaxID=474952 RepID=A0A239LQ66_9BACT|nr:MBL fold metallo-hydrolase [Granulicella rosea]SNT32837.1 metallo-beta-lactamase class B [Granulicella rosea]
MKKTLTLSLALFAASAMLPAQAYKMPDHPTVTVDGKDWTPLGIVTRNMGTAAEQEAQFPPHHIIGNIYYVGTKTLSSFLIVTPKGDILIDTTYERNVPVIEKSVKELGYKVSDIKIILGNHAHGDHMEGDAMMKDDTGGALVEVMAEDVPALKAMKPEGKEHPIDRIFHDGDTVELGGTVLTAHLVAGHTHGCTAFTTDEVENGKTYHVVFGCSLRSPNTITPEVAAEFGRTFPVVHAMPCDVMLGDHPSQYGMIEKYEKLTPGGPNPFIDKYTCHHEIDIEEAMFYAVMKEQAAKAAVVVAPKP